MPPNGYVQVGINVSPEEREQVNAIAKQRGFAFTSDYIRALIEADTKAHGIDFQFDVDRGGYRGKPK